MFSFRSFGAFALVFLAAAVLTACGGGEEKAAPPASGDSAGQAASQDAAQGSAALPADPLAAVTQALKNQQAAGPYRVKTTIDSASGKMEMSAEIVPPDQMRMVIDAGGQKQEMVFIGDKGWMKLDEEWTESPLKGSDMLAQVAAIGVDDLAATASEMKQAGTETVNGQEAMLYTYMVDMNKSTAMKMDVKSSDQALGEHQPAVCRSSRRLTAKPWVSSRRAHR